MTSPIEPSARCANPDCTLRRPLDQPHCKSPKCPWLRCPRCMGYTGFAFGRPAWIAGKMTA